MSFLIDIDTTHEGLKDSSSVAGRLWLKEFAFHFKQQCKENAALIILCIIAFLGMRLTIGILGEVDQRTFLDYIKRALFSTTPFILACYVFVRFFRRFFYEKTDDIISETLADLKNVIIDPRRYARMMPMLLFTSFGFIAFITFKVFIPKIIPFYGDTLFMEMDKFIHFGTLPTDWLAWLLDVPWVMHLLDYSYKFWYCLMFGLWAWAAWGASDNNWRRQYVLSFMLCWIIGGAVLATLLSSVGPCFYGIFVEGVNPYANYMAELNALHEDKRLMAVEIQQVLSTINITPEAHDVRIGISAMPSLHNTLAVLFAIAGYKIHRNFGHILAVYAVMIFIGSIALGWHYAIDGYAGLILAFAMWYLAAWILKVQDKWVAKIQAKLVHSRAALSG